MGGRGGESPQHPGSMRATELTLRATLIVLSYLARGCGPHMPKFPPAKRDQRACGISLLPASIFRSITSIEIPESQVWEGLGGVKKGVVRRLKVTGHLNPNHCSGLGNRASRPRWKGFQRGDILVPPTPKLRVEGGRTREQSVYNYFYLLFLESSSTWQQGGNNTVGKGKASDKAS